MGVSQQEVEEPSMDVRIANSAVILPTLFVGFVGNAAMALAFLTAQKKSHHFKWNTYVLSLAFFDLTFLASTALPNCLQYLIGLPEYGDDVLMLLTITSYWTQISSTLVKMLFCFEQLLNIYKPYRLFSQTSVKDPLIEIALSAAVSILHSVVWLANTPPPSDPADRREITLRKCNSVYDNFFEVFCFVDFYIFFAVPFLAIVVCSGLIAYRIARYGLDENLFRGVRETTLRIERSSVMGSEIAARVVASIKTLPIVVDLQNATRLMLATSVIFIVTALPYRLFSHINASVYHLVPPPRVHHSWPVTEEEDKNEYLQHIFCWIWYLNSAFCPVGFFFLSARFRENVAYRFRWVCWCRDWCRFVSATSSKTVTSKKTPSERPQKNNHREAKHRKKEHLPKKDEPESRKSFLSVNENEQPSTTSGASENTPTGSDETGDSSTTIGEGGGASNKQDRPPAPVHHANNNRSEALKRRQQRHNHRRRHSQQIQKLNVVVKMAADYPNNHHKLRHSMSSLSSKLQPIISRSPSEDDEESIIIFV